MANVRGCQAIVSTWFAGDQPWSMAIWRYASGSCMPFVAQNSLLYSALTDRAYVVFRGSADQRTVAVPIADPLTFDRRFISGFSGTPEAGALTPDGRGLLLVKQTSCQAPFQLDSYDTLGGALTSGTYTFSTPAAFRSPVDAKAVTREGGLPGMSGSAATRLRGLPGAGAWHLGLVAFGFALWRLDRRRSRA
jgi:hypothetical protein